MDIKTKDLLVVQNSLKDIENITSFIYDYQKDKRELFDTVPFKTNELKIYIKDIEHLNTLFIEDIKILDEDIDKLNESKSHLKNEFDK